MYFSLASGMVHADGMEHINNSDSMCIYGTYLASTYMHVSLEANNTCTCIICIIIILTAPIHHRCFEHFLNNGSFLISEHY